MAAGARRQGIAFLYVITRILTGQAYVGITINDRKRWNTHRWLAKSGASKQLLHRAMAKHGLEAFRFEVVACSRNWRDGIEAERLLIEQIGSHVSCGGYNLTIGGEGPTGRVCSPETRSRIGAANSGRPGRKITAEEKKASSDRLVVQRAQNPEFFYEYAKKGGKSQRGRVNSPETIARMRIAALKRWSSASTVRP